MRLSEPQDQAVAFPADGSLLVMAGAGSGKTTVIAYRAKKVSELLGTGKNLQMLTFSNKAAAEMKHRVKSFGPLSGAEVLFDTFHSFGMKLLKADPQGYKLPLEFSLLNANDVMRSIRALAKGFGLPKDIDKDDKKRLNPMNWYNTWSLARQAGYDVNNLANKGELIDRLQQAHQLSHEETAMAWCTLTGYEREKRNSGSVDFDDLLYMPLLRIAKDADYRSVVQSNLGYVIVDEYQDTNRIQYEMIRRIAQGHCGVTCVGDDDQSIYGWRGAEVSNMKRFLSNFNASELRLEQNYRSTKAIVDCAYELIQNNSSRLEKNPFSLGDEGSRPDLSMFDDSRAMANGIAQAIQADLDSGLKADEIAVLYRTNRMAQLIEQSLRIHGIPYHVVGGMSLFDRAEVVAVTSALRLARNPRDSYALKSLIPMIDGLGPGSGYIVAEWLDEAEENNVAELPDELPGLSRSRIDKLRAFYSELRLEALSADDPIEFVEWVIAGPMRVLDREKDDELREKREQHLATLVDDITAELAHRQEVEPDLSWRDVVIEVALRDARQSEQPGGQVTLSTLHRSKGLEYPSVLIAGMSEGLMPLDSKADVSDDEAAGGHLEEERRLTYVGITRAKQKCRLFHSNTYRFPGSKEDRIFEPSRFLLEMGYDLNMSPEQSDVSDFNAQDFIAEFSKLTLRG